MLVTQRATALPERTAGMPAYQINRVTAIVLIALSGLALLDVILLGYLRPPLQDEGTGAHIFQLSLVMMVLVGMLFLATADWTQPAAIVGRLAVPAVIALLALAALFYLENYYYPAHYPTFYQ
jgi:succinate dehydrogenase hydrophobic anchor subunit